MPNPIVVDAFPFRAEKEDYVLWIGRLNDDKGPQRAIAAALEADMRLILAGPVQPGEEEFFHSEVKPHIDDEQIKYIGEVTTRRRSSTRALRPCSCPFPGRSPSAS